MAAAFYHSSSRPEALADSVAAVAGGAAVEVGVVAEAAGSVDSEVVAGSEAEAVALAGNEDRND